jgi:hypothetical protein
VLPDCTKQKLLKNFIRYKQVFFGFLFGFYESKIKLKKNNAVLSKKYDLAIIIILDLIVVIAKIV